MKNGLRTLLLVALTMGICLSSFGSGERLCLETLADCCSREVVSDCSSDCCDSDPGTCCIVILSDDLAMVSPEKVVLDAVILSTLDYLPVLSISQEDSAICRTHLPDPPPLSGRERLARSEIQVI
ncbi:MAG: hypothetical protein P1U68_16035 [Verrucomicrobiales bacterium]|nr:hypothetical protein [Verrucomicrobiales bacterium]